MRSVRPATEIEELIEIGMYVAATQVNPFDRVIVNELIDALHRVAQERDAAIAKAGRLQFALTAKKEWT